MSSPSSTRATTLRTLKGEITLDAAIQEERDMLRRLSYWNKRIYFLCYLDDHSAEIEAIVSYHLGLSEIESCYIAPLDDWIHGSFNMCLPIHIKDREGHEKRVMMRFPLPYKVGEEECPGNAEEKLRCEAATYVWIQENCPDVPIPQLLGFAFHENQCVSVANPYSAIYDLLVFYSSHHYRASPGTSDWWNFFAGKYAHYFTILLCALTSAVARRAASK